MPSVAAAGEWRRSVFDATYRAELFHRFNGVLGQHGRQWFVSKNVVQRPSQCLRRCSEVSHRPPIETTPVVQVFKNQVGPRLHTCLFPIQKHQSKTGDGIKGKQKHRQ